MSLPLLKRRKFLYDGAKAAAGMVGLSFLNGPYAIKPAGQSTAAFPKQRIRFAVIGANHGHVYSLVETVEKGGGELVSFFAAEEDLRNAFGKRYPAAKAAANKAEILEDESIQLIISAAVPVERAGLGIEAMKHGKDFLVDKPGIISLEQLAAVKKIQKETKRIYSILYGDRLENKATQRAAELVGEGRIGKVIQTIGLGPHRMNSETRPEWFFDKQKSGGILTDLGSHQFDQFLFFTNSSEAEIVTAQAGNFSHQQYPEIEDFGDAVVRGSGGTGYLRVDWFTPKGLKTWGDGRLTILGTEGYIEIRKNIDIAGRTGGDHLFLVDNQEAKYIDCSEVSLNFGRLLVDDIVNRTETAMTQHHCFLATELSLRAQKSAAKISNLL